MADDSILDPEALQSLRALSPNDGGAFFRDLIEVFLQESDPRMAELARAFAARDAVEVTQLSHSIKGSCGNFGANRLQNAAFRIEQLAKRGAVDEAKPLLPEIESAYAATKQALNAILRESS